MTTTPGVGQVVLYTDRDGSNVLPAVVVMTTANRVAGQVTAGVVGGLTDASHVHLAVFSPGPGSPNADIEAITGFKAVYRENDVNYDANGGAGTWKFGTSDGYTPTTSGDWPVQPTTVADALDKLAARVKALEP